jgi:hypothetical protein
VTKRILSADVIIFIKVRADTSISENDIVMFPERREAFLIELRDTIKGLFDLGFRQFIEWNPTGACSPSEEYYSPSQVYASPLRTKGG